MGESDDWIDLFRLFLLLREKKLVEKASNHLQSTSQRFEDENALMSSCFFNLEDDIVNYEAHAARMHLLKNAAAIDRVVTLNEISSTEKTTREQEDLEVLDTLIQTQELLQQTVRKMLTFHITLLIIIDWSIYISFLAWLIPLF